MTPKNSYLCSEKHFLGPEYVNWATGQSDYRDTIKKEIEAVQIVGTNNFGDFYQKGVIKPPKGHLATCGDIFGCHN